MSTAKIPVSIYQFFIFFTLFTFQLNASAGVDACYSLVSGNFKKSDVSKAYTFISEHGDCLDRLGDTTFQAITAAIFVLKAGKKISQNTCNKVFELNNSGDLQTLNNIVGEHGQSAVLGQLSCACAVAYSGVDKKLKEIVDKIIECGKAFNPVDWAEDGLKAASGVVKGLGGVLNIGGKYAVGPNGGAPTSFYQCPVGKWLEAKDRGPEGVCYCPVKYKDIWGDGGNAPKGSMKCVADCPKEQILKDGKCQPCPSVGPNSQTHPDEFGLSCETMTYDFNCGGGKKKTKDGKSCELICPVGEIWKEDTKVCVACDVGQIAKYESGQGSIGKCTGCPMGMQALNNKCELCPAGSKWKAPGFCESAFPGKNCSNGNQIQDPLYPQKCVNCPAGQVANADHTECVANNFKTSTSPKFSPTTTENSGNSGSTRLAPSPTATTARPENTTTVQPATRKAPSKRTDGP